MARNKGFTLIEMMIVIAIFAVIAVVVTPYFLDYRDHSQVKGDAMGLRAAFETAKLRAIKHNTNVVVNFPDATSFEVFIDTNNNNAQDPGEDLIIDETMAPGVTITNNTFAGNNMAFNSRGMANGPNSTGTVTMASPGGERYNVVVSSFGRVRTEHL